MKQTTPSLPLQVCPCFLIPSAQTIAATSGFSAWSLCHVTQALSDKTQTWRRCPRRRQTQKIRNLSLESEIEEGMWKIR